MPRRKSEQMTPLELEIMQVLWETGPATVQTVQRRAQTRVGLHHGADDAHRAAPEEESEAHAQRQSLHLHAGREPHEVYRSRRARVYRSSVWRFG